MPLYMVLRKVTHESATDEVRYEVFSFGAEGGTPAQAIEVALTENGDPKYDGQSFAAFPVRYWYERPVEVKASVTARVMDDRLAEG